MENKPAPIPSQGQLLIYQDGSLRVQVRIDGKTVWLTQRLMAELYQVSVKTINEHLVNIYEEGELDPSATIRKFRIVQTEGSRRVSRTVDHYNLDAILAVGYRVRSHRGTAFRQWATARLIFQQMAEERPPPSLKDMKPNCANWKPTHLQATLTGSWRRPRNWQGKREKHCRIAGKPERKQKGNQDDNRGIGKNTRT